MLAPKNDPVLVTSEGEMARQSRTKNKRRRHERDTCAELRHQHGGKHGLGVHVESTGLGIARSSRESSGEHGSKKET
jgi:hypothetical protein